MHREQAPAGKLHTPLCLFNSLWSAYQVTDTVQKERQTLLERKV